MNENPECQLCPLHETANSSSICLKGEGDRDADLLIFLDAPTLVEDKRHRGVVSEASSLLKWMLRRMSVDSYYIDYIVKCYPKGYKAFRRKPERSECIQACSVYRFATLQMIKPKTVLAMGALSCETFLHSDKVGDFEGTHWTPEEPEVREYVEQVWVTYSPAYALEAPAESVGIYRTIQAAAMAAGLQPKLNLNIKPKVFDYGF